MSELETFRLVADAQGPAHDLPPGLSVLEASAGTGKTYCLVHVVLRELLSDPLLDPGLVLIVTFTKAAAAELRQRLRALIATAQHPEPDSHAARIVAAAQAQHGHAIIAARLRQLIDEQDRLSVLTIHGWCHQSLALVAREAGVASDSELVEDLRAELLADVRDYWRRNASSDALLAAAASTWGGESLRDDLNVATMFRHLPDCEIVAPSTVALLRKEMSETLHELRELLREPDLDAWLDAREFTQKAKDFAEVPVRRRMLRAMRRAQTAADDGELAWRAVAVAKGFRHLKSKDSKAGHDQHPLVLGCNVVARLCADLQTCWQAECAPQVDAACRQRLRDSGLISHHDVLRLLDDSLRGNNGALIAATLRERIALTLVDEFQDTDPLQWRILSTLCLGGARRLLVIGDPKQAIYGFRGGDLPTYIAACAQATTRWRLGINFRSAPRLVAAINACFSRPLPLLSADITHAPVAASPQRSDADAQPPLTWWLPEEGIGNEQVLLEQASAAMASEITRQVGTPLPDGSIMQFHDCAVLVRTRVQARIVRNQLQRHGISAALNDAGDLFESELVQDLGVVLAALADPGDRRARRRALITEIIAWNADDLLADAENGGLAETAVAQLLSEQAALWQRSGVAVAVDALLRTPWPRPTQAQTLSVLERSAARADGERRLTDLRHAHDWLSTQAQSLPPGPEAVVALFQCDPGDQEQRPSERRIQLDGARPAVAIVTMHAAKGLEWPTVLCPVLWHARAAQPPLVLRGASRNRLLLDAGDDARLIDEAEQQRLAEDLRLTYVAMTRAKYRLWIAWGAFGNHGKSAIISALAWLLGERSWTDWRTSIEKHSTLASRHAVLRAAALRLIAAHPTLMAHTGAADHGARSPSVRSSSAPPVTPAPTETPVAARLLPVDAAALTISSTASFTALTRQVHAREHIDDFGAAPAEALSAVAPDAAALLARGAAFGVAVHSLFEHHDWTKPVDETQVRAVLRDYGLADPAQHGGQDPVPVMGALLSSVATCDLGGWTMADLSAARREWRFDLPLRHLRGSDLAELFAQHGGEQARACAPRLADLSPRAWHGFLTGSIDLLALAGDAWWVVDWKSNYLEPRAALYSASRCWQAMRDERYVLQYHLYCLAVRRWLRRRGDARRVCASYVFVRGTPAQVGVVSDQPSAALLDALESCLEPGRI